MSALLVVLGICAAVVVASCVILWRGSCALDREIELLAASIDRLEAASLSPLDEQGSRER